VFGQLVVPEQLFLVGATTVAYPYGDDLSLIRAFISNRRQTTSTVRHPVDIRRQVASWALLALAIAIVIGWIVTLVMGRDPLAGAPDRVTPLPPAVGTAVFLGAIAAGGWFFMAGHHVFGPVATAKVRLLTSAASQNNAAGIREAAARGVFIDVRDGQGMTALMLAARADAVDAVDALLNAGAAPDARDNNDNTALMWAIQMDKALAATRLLDAPIDVAAADLNGRTALHLASSRGEATSVARLLKAGADPKQPDAHGWPPIIFAATSGSVETVRALLAAGADPRVRLPDNRTAADLAQGQDVLQAIRDAGGR
jgi:hypothetical protein